MKLKNWRLSYSQGGEDLILWKMLKHKKNGFFIDVGANKPVSLNNTYLFYKKGWRGLNFEPIPILAKEFQERRPGDIVINKAMSNFVGEANFYSGKKKYHVNSSIINIGIPQDIIKVSVDKLENILDELKISDIDFISIDTEGTEIDVLEGLNLNKYRPKFILIEYNTAAIANDKLNPYLLDKGYQPIFINTWNLIYSENFKDDAIVCYKPAKYSLRNIINYFKGLI